MRIPKSRLKPFLLPALLLVCSIAAFEAAGRSWGGLWSTPEQQFQRLYLDGRFEEAASLAADPMTKGAALYQAGQFQQAASVFGGAATPESLYNRGNAYLMQGLYDSAIASYEQALERRPDWQEAVDNLTLARLRKEKLAPPEDDAGGTGGMLEADEIVFDQRSSGKSSQTTEEQEDKPTMSKAEQRALWLRKVQTKPADFLRHKFSYQLSVEDN